MSRFWEGARRGYVQAYAVGGVALLGWHLMRGEYVAAVAFIIGAGAGMAWFTLTTEPDLWRTKKSPEPLPEQTKSFTCPDCGAEWKITTQTYMTVVDTTTNISFWRQDRKTVVVAVKGNGDELGR